MAIRKPGENRTPPRTEAEPELAVRLPPAPEIPHSPASEHLAHAVRRLRPALAESRNSEQVLAGLIESAMDAIIITDERDIPLICQCR